MSTDAPPPDPTPAEPEPKPPEVPEWTWRPDADFPKAMAFAAACTLLAGGLTVAGLTVNWLRPPQPGFTLALALGLAAIVPQLGVLYGFHVLGRAMASDGFRRAATGVYVPFWLIGLSELYSDDILAPGGQTALLIGLGLGLLLLAGYLLEGKGCGLGVLVYIGIKIILKVAAGRNAPKELAFGLVLLITAVVLLVCAIWFARKLFGAGAVLGAPAALLGVGTAVALVVCVAAFGWLMVGIVDAVQAAEQAGAAEPDFAAALAPQIRILTLVSTGGETMWACLTAYLFLSARGRALQPADDESAVPA